MTAAHLTDLASLVARIQLFDQADLEGLGACRIAEMRSSVAALAAAKSRAWQVTDRTACREAQNEAERLAFDVLEGTEWASDAVLYAHNDFLIGPALQALNDVVLAVLARHDIDRSSFEMLTSAFRESIGASDDSRGVANRP